MPVDATQKKYDEIRLIGGLGMGVLFQKVLPAGYNAGQVIIKLINQHYNCGINWDGNIWITLEKLPLHCFKRFSLEI